MQPELLKPLPGRPNPVTFASSYCGANKSDLGEAEPSWVS